VARKIIPYNLHLKELARKLRNESTPGEKILWNQLKQKRFGYDFDRQKPLLNYIVDFYCYELELIIEIDGKYHQYEDQYVLDVKRESELKTFGLTILRFNDRDKTHDLANVIRNIEIKSNCLGSKFPLKAKGHTPDPSQEGKRDLIPKR